MSQHKNRVGLLVSAVGVVFGDIGTSPLYALKETFSGHHPIPVNPENIFGVLSLVFWTVMLLVTVKYVIVIMRADNHGEGGSLALLALVTELTRGRRVHYPLMMLGVIAAALFYGDSMITPAISVLSAVEGLEVVTPDLRPYVVPITAVVLTALFAIQSRGTGLVGRLFGPVMCLWFITLAVLGIVNVINAPGVLKAISPTYAFEFVFRHPLMSFYALGSVVLAVTGGEALYTDMGHFGRFPIRLAWFCLVLPALLLNYFGQGALLIHDPSAIQNPFFRMGPEWMVVPLVALATFAAVIASQAVISGAYSVARQAIQLGLLPRMTIVHTSGEEAGQIYVPFTNWTLYLAVMALVVGFQSSSNLAAAYGIAVTSTMMIDTILVSFVMALLWRWNMALVITVVGTLLAVDIAFFSANIIKVAQGGWFPLFIGFISFTVLTTWRRGRALVRKQLKKQAVPLDVVLRALGPNVSRARGTAVFLTAATDGVPPALLHNLKHNQTVHQRVVLTTVTTAETPYVPDSERVHMTDIGDGFHRLIIRYGFMQTPDVPAALVLCKQFGHEFNMMSTSFFLSRETFVPSLNPGMALWRERLFSFMTLNATRATTFFKIPTDRVVELGTQLEI
ncbi:potassium transporter Kup [Rhodopseudomonas pseudopalustris]|uniref:Probable potassium transport system protein Kup 2 n=2 Tax=Rhodopseudomonas TaxID=1073 RepID=KUP2_RHOPS|nr:potassium transporter Kup [Rhodopseudomonas pseudopalustris]Q135T0.1 RecName: Full=Probable potassium transport system protein Kup 2 [Rhodopseudomonas palustris BisB5]ABE40159.1 K+ potassium transporter [Rhodopseudomonas palustris BisB5]MBB1090860.1 potassium transporter Kup [Rhodopseudomonas palustris]SEP27899.1 KUP system potassium uptake protein [Rhodopseudomonas pseudopalustris]